MSEALSAGNTATVAAIAGITGQTVDSATEMFCSIGTSAPDDTLASAGEISGAVNQMCTRVGLAPALDQTERNSHIRALRALTSGGAHGITRGDLHAWDTLLRAHRRRYRRSSGSRWCWRRCPTTRKRCG